MSDFDDFVAELDYPLYVVTVAVGDERAGCLVGFATQSSIDPPRFTVWISKANHTYGVVRRAEFMAVHLVAVDSPLPRLFGGETGDEVDKFARTPWVPGPGRTPILSGVLAWFAGRIETGIEDGGDHVGFVLAPVDGHADAADRRPFRLSDASDITPGHPA